MKRGALSLAMSRKVYFLWDRWKAPLQCAFRPRWRNLTVVIPKFSFHFPPALPALCWKVLEGKLNAAFIDGPINHTAIDGIPVYREELMIVTPQGHAPVTRASQVNGSNIYAFRANCSYRRHFESWFHADGAAPGTIHEMESYHGMLACVVAGAGIALIPRSMLESMPGHHQVEAWPLAEQWRWLTTWLVWRRGAKTRPLEAFIQLLDAPDSAKQGYQ